MSYENTRPATPTEIFIRNFKVLMSDVHTTMPGLIETYDGNRLCSVKPSIKRKLADGTFLSLPVITDVPVMFPGGPEFGMTWPLSQGTPVLIHICERSIEDWLQNGREASPEDLRRFSLTDAVAEPGLYHKGNPFPEANNVDFQILYKAAKICIKEDGTILSDNDTATFELLPDGTITADNGSANLKLVPSGNIELNGNSKTFVTQAELNTQLQAFVTTLNAYFGTITTGATAAIAASGLWLTPLPFAPIVLDISAAGTLTIKTGG